MQDSQKNDQERFNFAREMLAGPYVGDAKSALEFAVAFFGPLEDGATVKYLLQNPEHFDLLRQWNPHHSMLSLKPFMVKSGDLQSMTAEEFRNASACLCSHPDIIQLVAHPIAKALLKEWWNCAKILPDSSEARALSENLFFEASALKLQVPIGESSLPNPDWAEKNKDIKSKIPILSMWAYIPALKNEHMFPLVCLDICFDVQFLLWKCSCSVVGGGGGGGAGGGGGGGVCMVRDS